MTSLISTAGLLLAFAVVVSYPLYFLELHMFGQFLARDHPDLVGKGPVGLSAAYRYLRRVQTGEIPPAELSADALKAFRGAKRMLHVSAALLVSLIVVMLVDGALYEGRT